MTFKHVLSLFWALAVVAQAAEKIDLTYPPPGTRAPIIDQAQGERNSGALLSAEEARVRAKRYGQGHVIINPDFTVSVPAPVSSPPKPAASPEAKRYRAVARAAPVPAPAPPTGQKALLWKIEDQRAKPSHLFGTAHLEDPRILNLPPVVKDTLKRSRSFTTEVLFDEINPQDFSTAMIFTDGRSLEGVAGKELSDRAAELLKARGMPKRITTLMKPWAAAVTLSTPKPETGVFLDMSLYLTAKNQGKAVYGLETVEEQFSALDDIPMADQVYLLRASVQNYPRIPAMVEKMIERYLARDLPGLLSLARKYGPKDKRIVDAFMKKLIDDRNQRMVERMLPRLKEGGAFIAIGALHLPGKNGVLQILKERGYRVTAVY